MIEVGIILAAVLYGGLIGLIPSAGPGKAIILLFSIIALFDFPGGDYLFVLFSIVTVVSCSIGDSFASVLLGIPGASGSAATMVDGYPLAKQGRASYALSSAIFTSTINGVIFGALGLLIIPYYPVVVKVIGIPEIFGLLILAFCMISALTTKHTIRSLLSVCGGLFIGSIGFNLYGIPRHTAGIEYLNDGIPIVIVVAGLFAIPEILEALTLRRGDVIKVEKNTHKAQTWEGIRDSIKHKWISLQGGAVGYITGLMPGTAGGIGDWVAYALVASQNKKDKIKFGEGNIKGVIGSEGANNSGKMGALLPTIIFGIPGNKMYAILMALWIYVGFEVGDLSVMEDTKFLTHLFGGYMVGTVIAGILMIVLARYLSRLMEVKLAYWMVPLGLLIIWSILSSRHYVTVQEDLILLTVFSYIGYLCKSFKFSRPALLMAYVLFEKLESTFYMMKGIYFINNDVWLEHPMMTIFFILSVLILFYGRKVTMNYN